MQHLSLFTRSLKLYAIYIPGFVFQSSYSYRHIHKKYYRVYTIEHINLSSYRALSVLAEDLSLILSTYVMVQWFTTIWISSSRGSLLTSLAPGMHMVYILNEGKIK